MIKTYGLLLRVYTPKQGEVPGRVMRTLEHIAQAYTVMKEFPRLTRLVILVPEDYDCGLTAEALQTAIAGTPCESIVQVLVCSGHHSREVLNQGLAHANELSHVLIVSGKAMSHLTAVNLAVIDTAFDRGAKVAGLGIDELADIVCSGRIQNTFAAWDIESLVHSGGFTSDTGVEEMDPLIRFVQVFGRCIAPIRVVGGQLDVHTDASSAARHQEVMESKVARQLEQCDLHGVDFVLLERAIMPSYPIAV